MSDHVAYAILSAALSWKYLIICDETNLSHHDWTVFCLGFLYLITNLKIAWNYPLKSVQQDCNCSLPAIHNINNIRIWRSPMINIVFCFQAWGFPVPLNWLWSQKLCSKQEQCARLGVVDGGGCFSAKQNNFIFSSVRTLENHQTMEWNHNFRKISSKIDLDKKTVVAGPFFLLLAMQSSSGLRTESLSVSAF